jgi:hypothetical protein
MNTIMSSMTGPLGHVIQAFGIFASLPTYTLQAKDSTKHVIEGF